MLDITYPWAFVLTIAPLIVFALTPAKNARQTATQIPHFKMLVEVSGKQPQQGVVSVNRTRTQRSMLILGWLCLVIAMAKPVWISDPIERQKSARDIMVALDLSGSMIKKDFQSPDGKNVTRLQAAKSVLADFAKHRTSDRLGLILFGDKPYLQAPMTDQIDVWTQLLEETALGVAGWQTAIGDAIGLSIKVFEQEQTSNPVLVLISDGNDTVSRLSPTEAATVASKYGIKIHTVAMGNPKAEGDYRVDVEALRQVAKITGGESFQAQNRVELERIYEAINQLEPTKYEGKSYRPKISLHYIPLAFYLLTNLIMFFPLLLRKYHQLSAGKPVDTAS
ncbi:VWA domain-containing protein [Vibrio lamellibrachiae]|uniref:VWA domain-containing protein n=1 Tax=Vibrio lamellibrachiae TaxID=2910253 RepID=UPI003D0EEFBF